MRSGRKQTVKNSHDHCTRTKPNKLLFFTEREFLLFKDLLLVLYKISGLEAEEIWTFFLQSKVFEVHVEPFPLLASKKRDSILQSLYSSLD